MTVETSPEGAPRHEGQYWLDFLQCGQYADNIIQTEKLGPIQGRDFLLVTGDHVLPILNWLEKNPDHPDFAKTYSFMQKAAIGHLVPNPEPVEK